MDSQPFTKIVFVSVPLYPCPTHFLTLIVEFFRGIFMPILKFVRRLRPKHASKNNEGMKLNS